MCQVVAFQIWISVRWNRSSTCQEISQSRGPWIHKPGENNRCYAGSFGLWGSLSEVFLNLISTSPDGGARFPLLGSALQRPPFRLSSSGAPPCGVRSLQNWGYAHLEPIPFWIRGTWNPLSYSSQAGFLGLHRPLAQVPLEIKSPHQCVYFWARGVAKEFGLQGCGWKLGVRP